MKKIINQDGRLFGLVSVIDVAVILVVIVLGIALNLKFNHLEPTSTTVTNIPITFTVSASSVPDYAVDSIQVGDVLYDHDQETGGPVGTILSIERGPAYTLKELPNGTLVDIEDPTCYDLILVVQGEGNVVDGHYRINRIYEIGVNASRNFYSLFVGFQGEILEIHE